MRTRAEDAGFVVTAFTADSQFLSVPTLGGLPFVPYESLQQQYPPTEFDVFVAVGYRSMRARSAIFSRVRKAGYRCPAIISPDAVMGSNVLFGDNTFVPPGAVVEPNVQIGSNNVFWPGVVICHHTKIGDHNYFSPSVTVCGNCTIGTLSFFGASSTVVDGIEVGWECQLMPGAVLTANAPSFGKYGGVPARRLNEVDGATGVCILR